MRTTQEADLFETAFGTVPLMAILRGLDVARTVGAARRAWDLGIALVEVPVQDETAVCALRAAVEAGAERGAVPGAGTVTSLRRLEKAAAAGAAFTVAPGFDPEVAHASVAAGLPHLPGVATPTEVQRALAAGFGWLKAFPAAQLGPGWVRAMHGPFPQARFVVTGGMRPGTTEEFLDAGASAVALGSALSDAGQYARMPRLVQALQARRKADR